METIYINDPFQVAQHSRSPIVIALGFFDGVHIGHHEVIRSAGQLAQKLGTELGVMTFYPHPKEVLSKEKKTFHYITPLPHKLSLFAQIGVDKVFVVKFTSKFAALEKEEFIEKILVPMNAVGVVTGFNFTFGRFAAGTPQDLMTLGADYFETLSVPPIMKEGEPVSSTRVRKALDNGDMEEVQELLHRPFQIKGKVVHGDQRGREIGFPTANILLEEPYHIPKIGVYVADVWIPELKKSATGIMNIGYRPTVTTDDAELRVEVHLLGEQVDLYGKEIEVNLLHFMRPEMRFPSFEALKEQLIKDRETALNWDRKRKNG